MASPRITVELPLTQGKSTLLDAGDFERLGNRGWQALQVKPGYWYATATSRPEPKRRLFLHHEILNAPKGALVDHINGNTLDNRRCNLRLATRSQNQCNVRRLRRGASGFIGVYRLANGSYIGRVRLHLRYHHAGTFNSPEAAARARDALALHLHGDFAVLNFQIERVST